MVETIIILYNIPVLLSFYTILYNRKHHINTKLFLFNYLCAYHHIIRLMEANKFLNRLTDLGWTVDFTPVDRSKITLPALAQKRLSKTPQEFIDFICSFSETASHDETQWFLSYKDYQQEYGKADDAFVWNTFEMDSLTYADEEMKKEIEEFWDNFIPFYMSVGDYYSYIAICVNAENYGKIYQGSEPEYEVAELIAPNLPSFLNKFLLTT